MVNGSPFFPRILQPYGFVEDRMLEELLTGGRIIRPAYKSVALPKRYVPLDERISNYLTSGAYVPAEDRVLNEEEEPV